MDRRKFIKGVAAASTVAVVPFGESQFPLSPFQRSRIAIEPKNTLSTIDMVTREALRILHKKMMFFGKLDANHAIGDTLNIRMPRKY
ncbi:MAG: twin-arginine translocation signal domain-containing protein [Candidatus Thorarchaeota archaeon]